jgi:hypothetical protein
MLPAELPDELPEEIANAILEGTMAITALLNERGLPPPIGPLAVRAWIKIWESRELDEDATSDAVAALLKEEWRKEVAEIKKRTVV